MNTHYVSRSLTKPWEDSKRVLHYYDFALDKIDFGFSESLLAEENILSPEQELFFGKFIETPIGIFKKDILSQGKADIHKWPIYRALMLYFTFQTERLTMFLGKNDKQKTMFDLTETELDQAVLVFQKKWDLAYITLQGGEFTYFPSTGLFQIPIQDTFCLSGWQFTFAFPIDSRIIIYLHSKTFVPAYLPLLQKNIHRYSVGVNNNCSKVIFPANALELNSPDKIKEHIINTRLIVIQEFQNIHKLRNLVYEMYLKAGVGTKLVNALEVE